MPGLQTKVGKKSVRRRKKRKREFTVEPISSQSRSRSGKSSSAYFPLSTAAKSSSKRRVTMNSLSTISLSNNSDSESELTSFSEYFTTTDSEEEMVLAGGKKRSRQMPIFNQKKRRIQHFDSSDDANENQSDGDDLDEDNDDDGDNNRLYCICRSSSSDFDFMVSCDGCDEWFHGKCVGVTEENLPTQESYFCMECLENPNVDKPAHYFASKRIRKLVPKEKKEKPVVAPPAPTPASTPTLMQSADNLEDDEEDICVECDGECTCKPKFQQPPHAQSEEPEIVTPPASSIEDLDDDDMESVYEFDLVECFGEEKAVMIDEEDNSDFSGLGSHVDVTEEEDYVSSDGYLTDIEDEDEGDEDLADAEEYEDASEDEHLHIRHKYLTFHHRPHHFPTLYIFSDDDDDDEDEVGYEIEIPEDALNNLMEVMPTIYQTNMGSSSSSSSSLSSSQTTPKIQEIRDGDGSGEEDDESSQYEYEYEDMESNCGFSDTTSVADSDMSGETLLLNIVGGLDAFLLPQDIIAKEISAEVSGLVKDITDTAIEQAARELASETCGVLVESPRLLLLDNDFGKVTTVSPAMLDGRNHHVSMEAFEQHPLHHHPLIETSLETEWTSLLNESLLLGEEIEDVDLMSLWKQPGDVPLDHTYGDNEYEDEEEEEGDSNLTVEHRVL